MTTVAILLCVLANAQGGMEATLGVGAGSGTIGCSACTHAGTMGGTAWTLKVIQRVSPSVRVGWTTDWWAHSGRDWDRGIWALSAVAFYYPGTLQGRGFFLGGGPSYSEMVASVTDTTAMQRHGWGFTTELGYDMGPRSRWSFTPYFQYSYAWVGNVYYPKGSGIPFARDWKHQVVSIGVGLTWHELHQ